MIAFLEQGCRFRKPVLLGDTVHAEFEVAGLERKGDTGVLRLRMLRQIPLRRRGDVPHEALLLDGAVSRRFDGWVGANVAWAAVAEPLA
jgi:acyl dehydratase